MTAFAQAFAAVWREIMARRAVFSIKHRTNNPPGYPVG